MALATAAAIASCGPSYQGSYPSYEAVISQYVPPGTYRGVVLEDAAHYPPGPYCDCPRVWYDDHWVYYYHGRWIYWHHDCWYWYPVFYVYYWGGLPYVYVGPARSIHQADSPGGSGAGQIHHAYPAARPSTTSLGGSSRSPQRERESAPPPRRSKGDRRK